MSEYQYIDFRAIDGPVSQANLAYMRQQSSRADITPWSFTNEYHFGDFHGDAMEMMRRGYDVHMHYANFGIRSLYIRLSHGLPDGKAVRPYLEEESFRFVKDRAGGAGVLAITPYYEPDGREGLWDPEPLLERLVPLRNEILAGDLRPLYLAHLAVSCDDEHDPQETLEAPAPAGLDKLTPAQQALAEFYQIDEALIAAAAQAGGTPPSQINTRAQHAQWIDQQPQSAKDAWLVELMGGSEPALRGKLWYPKFKAQRPTCPPPRRSGREASDRRRCGSA